MRTLCVASLLLPALAASAGDEAARDKVGQDAFVAYLRKEHPGKRCQSGPSRLNAAAVRAAYGNRRFYFVFSKPPLPPGATIKSVQDAYRRKVEDIRKNHISLTAAVDEEGNVVPLLKPADFDGGLMKVRSGEDARTAAAAILSLFGSGQNGPGAVEAREVSVTKGKEGWECEVHRKDAFQGRVAFDASGKCVAVSKAYAGPLPK